MVEEGSHAIKELPNIVTILAGCFEGTKAAEFLHTWQSVIFSLIIAAAISIIAHLGSRKKALIPGRLQCALELLFGSIDDFVCGIMGHKGRTFTPFIGTLFIYILIMNLSGLIPLMKASTTSWSTTLALALCVFAYVQYTAIKELGVLGYIDHLMEKPRGFLAWTAVIPVMMLVLHIVSEIVRPVSLSLRLRSNIWGDDMLLGVFAGFGLTGVPLLIFNGLLAIIVSLVQTLVFCLLTTIYLTLVMPHDEHQA